MNKRLYRSRKDAILGGVAGGLANYFGVDVVVVRLLIVLMAFLFPTGTVIVAYIVAWLIIPPEPRASENVKGEVSGAAAGVGAAAQETPSGEPGPEKTSEATGETKAEVRPPEVIKGEATRVSRNHDAATRQFLGWALVIIGAILLARQFTPLFWWEMPLRVATRWWPVALVVLGVAVVISAVRR